MAQGEFTVAEVKATCEAVQELLLALPQRKRMEYIGHANDIFLFLDAAEKIAAERDAALRAI